MADSSSETMFAGVHTAEAGRMTIAQASAHFICGSNGGAKGDLDGYGRWHFSRQGTVSVVRYEWHVRSTRCWMNLTAPLVRSLFIRNHARVMEQGGEGLARRLSAPFLGQEHIDLLAASAKKSGFAGRNLRRIDPAMTLAAGMIAGTTATAAELAL
jgi:hypothetical protein